MLDEQVEQDGVKILIDNKALLNIIGSEMDWLEDKLNQRFIFKNPNISKSTSRTFLKLELTIM
jgi:Fe-S cluster assembly iron-binding protein IscA